MILFSYDFNFLILFFPGVVFSILSIITWLLMSNFILQKIDKNQELTFSKFVNDLIKNIFNQPIGIRYSKGVFYLLIEFAILWFFQILILGNFFGLNKYNAYFLLFILLIGILLEVFYQLDLTSNILIFTGKIISGFIIIVSLGLLLLEQNQNSFVDLSNHLVNHFSLLDIVLFLLLFYALSKLSTYMDYKKIPVLLLPPNDVIIYKNKIEKGNPVENYLRWILESFHQIIISQLLVFIIFPLTLQLLGIQGPLWIQFFLFITFQLFFLLASLFINLINTNNEFKLPNQQSKGIIIFLLLLVIIVLG